MKDSSDAIAGVAAAQCSAINTASSAKRRFQFTMAAESRHRLLAARWPGYGRRRLKEEMGERIQRSADQRSQHRRRFPHRRRSYETNANVQFAKSPA